MKKSVIGLTLLATMILAGCQKGKTSVSPDSEIASTSPSTAPVSDSTSPIVSDSVSVSPSTSTSVSVDTDTAHQLTRDEFIALFTSGLTNVTLKETYVSAEPDTDPMQMTYQLEET